MSAWKVLGIAPTDDEQAIRHAYARQLKSTRPEDDPDGFMRLRRAYDNALQQARAGASPQDEDEDTEEFEAPDRDVGEPAEAMSADEPPDSDVEAIVARLKAGDEPGAVAHLQAALDAPRLVALEARGAFERSLLQALANRKPLPLALCKAAIDHFRWQESIDHLSTWHRYLALQLLKVPEAEWRLDWLRKQSRRSGLANTTPLSAWLLLSPYRPWVFHPAFMLTDDKHLHSIEDLLNDLYRHNPLIPEQYLDPRTVRWWRDAFARPAATKKRQRQLYTAVYTLGIIASGGVLSVAITLLG